jgi:hypothetical protein
MDDDAAAVRDAVLEVIETSLDAQLKAIRRLRASGGAAAAAGQRVGGRAGRIAKKGMSQVDMAYDILSSSSRPLHINEILAGIKERFEAEIDRESLVSALSKRVVRGDRFQRAGKNVFGLLQ